MQKYWKAIAMVVATLVSAAVAALVGDNTISATEWVNVAIAGVGAAAVFAAPNVPYANYTKSVIAVLMAVLTLLASVITDGLTTVELLQIVVVALGAVGVYAKANAPSNVVT